MAEGTGYIVDRVVICDAFSEPDKHYQLLPGGRSRLVETRRPSMRYLASAKEVKGGIAGVLGRQASLFEDLDVDPEQLNPFINDLRDEVREWRVKCYPGTALVTRRLLEWWFERDEERENIGRRFFFCQQEALETLIYLYEVKSRHKMPETGDLIRYALKLATGTGKTLVMAMIVTWATLHKQKVSGSPLSANFLVLTPNLTVRDRVSGHPRGDGLDPAGAENLYDAFETVPPEYQSEFHPNILVTNWQAVPLEAKREDWISDELGEEGRFMPASVLYALRRRARQDPNAPIRRFLNGWRDLIILNDEAHHVYGEKRTRKGEDPEYIKWNKIIDRVGKASRISCVIDLSATPWYGSGSPKPEGALFEWLVSDFSVYDAFESGLVKVVRLPEQTGAGSLYLDLWDHVGGAKSKHEYLSASRGAIEHIYADWCKDFQEWQGQFEILRPGPAPVLLVVADTAKRAGWLFDYLSRDLDLLRNPDSDDPQDWVTIEVNTRVFDAEKGKEAILRQMVNTVGKKGEAGERVRCIVSVNMLSEGWDVKSVTHILGLRAFGSPLLTEQIIGRGLRRTTYDPLYQPIEERSEGADQTVDAFGIPFVGFPVQKHRRAPAGQWGQKPVSITKDPAKAKYRIRVPNVRSWAVGVTEPLSRVLDVNTLPELVIDPRDTPPEVRVTPVVGGKPEAIMTFDQFRAEYPLLRSKMVFAQRLFEATNPGNGDGLLTGPTYEELLELASEYVDTRVTALDPSEKRDIAIYYWARKALDILETAVRDAPIGTSDVPILGDPDYLDTEHLRPSQWTGIVATGRKTHTTRVPCHTDLERQFADFLDTARDVLRYFKNERFGFSITYYENNRPRQYFPDFIVVVRQPDKSEAHWIVETKGEIRHSTQLKRESADLWCQRMTGTAFGTWQHLFVQQRIFQQAMAQGVQTFAALAQQPGTTWFTSAV